MRTNIEIESSYIEAVLDRDGVHTKTEAVDLALRHLAVQPMSRDEALAMRGAHARTMFRLSGIGPPGRDPGRHIGVGRVRPRHG